MAEPPPYGTDPEKQQYQQQGYEQQPAAYPPQAQYPPVQQQQAAQTVVVAAPPQPVVVSTVVFGEFPVTMTNSKGQQITTQLEYKTGTFTWVLVAFLCFFGFWCCAPIPLCIDFGKDIHHIDPTDGSVVGVHKRF